MADQLPMMNEIESESATDACSCDGFSPSLENDKKDGPENANEAEIGADFFTEKLRMVSAGGSDSGSFTPEQHSASEDESSPAEVTVIFRGRRSASSPNLSFMTASTPESLSASETTVSLMEIPKVKDLLRDASSCMMDGRHQACLRILMDAEKLMPEPENSEQYSPDDYWGAKYLFIKSLLELWNKARIHGFSNEETLNEARWRISFLEEVADTSHLAAVHFQSSRLFLEYNDFSKALDEVRKGQLVLNTCTSEPFCVPGFNSDQSEVFKETVHEVIKQNLDEIECSCTKNLAEPTFKCNGSNCESLHVRKKMYESDWKPKFQGFHQLKCSENCLLRYHPACWKKLEKDCARKVKDWLGTECMTPDCSGHIKKHLFRDIDGKDKGVAEIEAKTILKGRKEKVRQRESNKSPSDFGSVLPVEKSTRRDQLRQIQIEEGGLTSKTKDDASNGSKENELTVESDGIPPPDLPALPLTREQNELEFVRSKKHAKKQRERERSKEMHVIQGLGFRLGSSSVEDEDNDEGSKASQFKPIAALTFVHDISELSSEEKHDLARFLEETSVSVKDFIQFVADVLVDKGSWLPIGEGAIGDAFRGIGSYSDVQKLIDIYGSKKAFLEMQRDGHRFLVDPDRNMVNLIENALNESIMSGMQSITELEGRSDGPHEVPLKKWECAEELDERKAESDLEEWWDDDAGEEDYQKKERERDVNILKCRLENATEHMKIQARQITDLNDSMARLTKSSRTERDQLRREKDEVAKELEAVKREALIHQTEMNKLTKEIKDLREKVKQTEKSEREKFASKETELLKNLMTLGKEKNQLWNRATGAEIMILKHQEAAYMKQCQELVDSATKEMNVAHKAATEWVWDVEPARKKPCSAVCSRLNTHPEQKLAWAGYMKEWLEFRKQVEHARDSVKGRFESQMREVEKGISLVSLTKVALCPIPVRPAVQKPEEPLQIHVLRPVAHSSPILKDPPKRPVEQKELGNLNRPNLLIPTSVGLKATEEMSGGNGGALHDEGITKTGKNSTGSSAESTAVGKKQKRKLDELEDMVREEIPNLATKDFQMAVQRVRNARGNAEGLRGLKLTDIAELLITDLKGAVHPVNDRNEEEVVSAQRTASVNDCAICLNDLNDGQKLETCSNCQHNFHFACLDMWIRTCATCPTCRRHFRLEKDFPALK